MLFRYKEIFSQFIKFAIIGCINTSVDFAVYIGLTRFAPFFEDQIYLANACAFIVAATLSFFANRTWTFGQTTRPRVSEAIKFYSTTGTGFLLNTSILFIFVSVLNSYDLLGKVVATGVTMMWNFLLNKFWVFKK